MFQNIEITSKMEEGSHFCYLDSVNADELEPPFNFHDSEK